MRSQGVSVLIPTLNEAANIPAVVANALQLGPVFVLDSFSTDGTQELARIAGATVVEHAFESYARQKNWGLDNLPIKTEWVFILDADERIKPALRDEILEKVFTTTSVDGLYVNRLTLIFGGPVRHGGMYPSWNLRLLRVGSARYEDRSVHEHMICSGGTGYLRNEMLHLRRETLHQHIDKHIRYAKLEADEFLKARLGVNQSVSVNQLFRRGLFVRQWMRRHVWPRIPFRPLIRFLYMYIVRLGFLDGKPGFHLATLMANYEYMIFLFFKEQWLSIKERARQDSCSYSDAYLRLYTAKASGQRGNWDKSGTQNVKTHDCE